MRTNASTRAASAFRRTVFTPTSAARPFKAFTAARRSRPRSLPAAHAASAALGAVALAMALALALAFARGGMLGPGPMFALVLVFVLRVSRVVCCVHGYFRARAVVWACRRAGLCARVCVHRRVYL